MADPAITSSSPHGSSLAADSPGVPFPFARPRPLVATRVPTSRINPFTEFLRHDWVPGLLCLSFDIVGWLAIYGAFNWLRAVEEQHTAFPFLVVELVQLAVLLLALFIVGGYDRRTDSLSLAYTSEHLFALVGAAVVGALLIYSIATYDAAMKPSRGALLASLALFAPLSLLYRRLIAVQVTAHTARKTFLVLGAGPVAAHFFEAYRASPNRQQLRFVDLQGTRAGAPLAGPGSPEVEAGDDPFMLAQICVGCSGVILADDTAAVSPELLEYLVQIHYQGTPVYTLDKFYEVHWRRVPVYALDAVWPLRLGAQLSRNSPYLHLKRLFDLAFSGVALLLCAPILLLLALLVRCDSHGPALFRQTRIGRDNQPFTILKFRTMFSRRAGEPAGELYTREGDARITRVGHWLRKLRLDELPQLWNVFRGEMSLIGPRAEWDQCVELYETRVPHYRYRHLVKPGITGWAQVNYPYGASEEDAFQKLKYDLYYIRHYSLKLDAMIVLKTLHVMLFGKGR